MAKILLALTVFIVFIIPAMNRYEIIIKDKWTGYTMPSSHTMSPSLGVEG